LGSFFSFGAAGELGRERSSALLGGEPESLRISFDFRFAFDSLDLPPDKTKKLFSTGLGI
jgi:hypothetical protein